MARYEKTGDGEGKFWEITRKGRVVTTRAGKVGAGASRDRDGVLYLYDRRGRTTDRELPDEDTARKQYDKLVAAKLKEGYKLVDGIDAAPIAAIEIHINAELEDAIVAAPDEVASYLVYADWLIARGDPRGELITLQHGMRAQSDPAKFMTFKKQEEALRQQHLRSWLGDIAGPALHRLKLDWRWGFFEGIRVDRPEHASEVSLRELVEAVLACPLARVVRKLALRGNPDELAAAVPDEPPGTLRSLTLYRDGWGIGALAEQSARLDAVCARYTERGITTQQDRWDNGDDDDGAPGTRRGGRYRPYSE